MGQLIPVLVQETVPGDYFNIESESMIRLAPMLAPIMHQVDAYIHYFFVPNRILWDNWEDFITGNDELSAPTYNYNVATTVPGSLWDYLGAPTHMGETGNIRLNTLPVRAYKSIYNNYYRDQNLIPEFDLEQDGFAFIFKRAWEKDYFTSALPWAQKGEEVSIPITSDEVRYGAQSSVIDTSDNQDEPNADLWTDSNGRMVNQNNDRPVRVENIDSIEAQITINELREATALQRWLEKNARAGSRYIESILAHFGVISDDARLQRPEYLGGGRSPVVVSEVVNTTGFTDDEPYALPQGNLAGHGLNVGRTNKATCYTKEHGWIMGIMSVVPKPAYQQGIPRHLLRTLKEDYYWPEFANLGEQEVLNKELFYDQDGHDDDVFGYQERYAEYRHAQDTVHGYFRTNLNFWHMGRIFETRPHLNGNFITCEPTDRIFAVTGPTHHMWAQVYNKVYAKRPMPKRVIPHI